MFYFLCFFTFSCGDGLQEVDNFIEDQISTENVEIYLLNNLNDSRGFCIDIKGSKQNANIDAGLQVHTCYSYQGQISVDQGFDKSKINLNEFYISFFKVCIEAEIIQESSSLSLNLNIS